MVVFHGVNAAARHGVYHGGQFLRVVAERLDDTHEHGPRRDVPAAAQAVIAVAGAGVAAEQCVGQGNARQADAGLQGAVSVEHIDELDELAARRLRRIGNDRLPAAVFRGDEVGDLTADLFGKGSPFD